MPDIRVTDLAGDTRTLTPAPGLTLMEVLREAGYDEILALCGGCCSCATCHVHIKNPSDIALPPMEEDEQMLLEMSDNYDTEHSRLSCQIPLTDQHHGLEIQLVEVD